MDDECITAMTKYYCGSTRETEMRVKQVCTHYVYLQAILILVSILSWVQNIDLQLRTKFNSMPNINSTVQRCYMFFLQWEYGPVTSLYLILLKQKLSGKSPTIIGSPMWVVFLIINFVLYVPTIMFKLGLHQSTYNMCHWKYRLKNNHLTQQKPSLWNDTRMKYTRKYFQVARYRITEIQNFISPTHSLTHWLWLQA